MTPLTVTVNIDDSPWTDIDRGNPRGGQIARVAGIPNGTDRGLPAVAVAIQLADGSWVTGMTTLRLLDMAVRGIKAGLIGRGLLDMREYDRD